MFKKVLISDDLGSINKGVFSVLEGLNINTIEQVQYCDDTYLKIKKGNLDQSPFDLLITDLSFTKDHREQKYTSGEALIIALNKEYPELKVIVYSVEDRLQRVRLLINTHQVNGYVCKGRNGLSELKKAIQAVYNNDIYLSPEVQQALNPKTDLEIDDFDIQLLDLLSKGLSQDDISKLLKKNNITPSSLSSIEKKLNRLKIQFQANNAIHLIATVKDLGLI